MSRERKTQAAALTLIAVVVVGTFLARGPLGGSPATADGPGMPLTVPSLRRVVVRTPERRTIKRVVRVPADVAGWQEATLASRVTGYVKSIGVDVGSHVECNAELAVLDVPDLEGVLASAQSRVIEASALTTEAKAALESALAMARQASAETEAGRAALARSRAEKEKAEAELGYRTTVRDRLEAVLAASPNLVSMESVAEARGKAATAKAEVAVEAARIEEAKALAALAEAREAAAKARIDAAGGALQAAKGAESAARAAAVEAEKTLGFATFRAPFSGIVTDRFVDVGALVRGSSGSQEGARIVRLVDTSKVRVRFRVAEPDSSAAKKESAFRLVVDAVPGKEFKGTVARVSEALDLSSRTMVVEGDLDNPEGVLRAGMFGRVFLDLEPHENALVVPAEAVTTVKRKSSVLVVEDGKVAKRGIKIGADDGISVEVVEGLGGEEKVVTTGKDLVSEGDRVEAVAEPAK
ncbi:MAG: efflux RND transporter periplasmic adaptor subunit [Planctomycetes bacterium]|nr:efflux RND transporter periplasmic adaptor subunit [Planctomycetota bacterium]